MRLRRARPAALCDLCGLPICPGEEEPGVPTLHGTHTLAPEQGHCRDCGEFTASPRILYCAVCSLLAAR